MTQPAPTLDQEILEELGFEEADLADLPGRIGKISWQGSDAWEKGKDVPGNPSMFIHSMYATSSDEERVEHVAYVLGDIRVYQVPKQGGVFRRVTINRASPAITHEDLSRTAFIQEVVREIQELSSLEEEKLEQECPNLIEGEPCENLCKPEAVFCDQCGFKLPDEEEEEEVETPAPPEPAAASDTFAPVG
jgi:hypothetical protein